MTASEPVVGAEPQQLGRYRLLETIAAGAMSTVYRAELTGTTKPVAIKRLHPHLLDNRELVASFGEQVRITSCVQHKNVAAARELVEADGEVFFVMEHVAGKTLAALLEKAVARKAPVPLGVGVAVALDMLRGLQAAHEARDTHGKPLDLVHRDVSPHHVIVGTDGVSRIIDFGAAKAAGGGESTAADAVSTSPYMAPEQARGTLVDRRADVYACAAVLWEILVGRRMVSGTSEVEIFDAISRGEVVDPSKLEPRIPKTLATAIVRGLADDVKERWQTAHDFASALEQAQKGALAKDVGTWVESLSAEPKEPRAAATPVAKVTLAKAPATTAGSGAAPPRPSAARTPTAPPAAPTPPPAPPLPSSAKLRAAASAAPPPLPSSAKLPAAAAVTSVSTVAAAAVVEPPPAPFPPSPSAPILTSATEVRLPEPSPPPAPFDPLGSAPFDPLGPASVDELLAATDEAEPAPPPPEPVAKAAWPAELESAPSLAAPAAMEADDLEPLPPVVRRRSPLLLVGGIAAVVAVVLILVLVTRRGPTPRPTLATTASAPSSASAPSAKAAEPVPPASAAETVAAPPPPPPPAPAPPPEPEPAPTPVAVADPPPKPSTAKTPAAKTAPVAAPAPAPAPAPVAAPAPAKPKPKAKKTCAEDPFFIGNDGLKRVRPECMK